MTLLEKYIIARWCYAIGEEFIGDTEYSQIHSILHEEMPDNEYVLRSWSDDPCPIELLKKFDLYDDYYRDIKFAYASESIRSINTEEEVERTFKGLKKKTRVSFKEDGFNIQVNYYNGKPISADTRGRTGNSLSANTVMAIVPQSIPVKGKVKVTGECVIKKQMWELFKLETGNTSIRNSVSTALANNMTEFIDFVAFDIKVEEDVTGVTNTHETLASYGFMVPLSFWVETYEQLMKAITLLGKRASVYAHATDGVVVENDDVQVALRIGYWKEETIGSYVLSYEENIGSYKNSIVVNIQPIVVDGAKRSQVSTTNLQYILDCDLQIGSPIAFDIRSGVGAVLNTTMTEHLHNQYAGRYDQWREEVDTRIAIENATFGR